MWRRRIIFSLQTNDPAILSCRAQTEEIKYEGFITWQLFFLTGYKAKRLPAFIVENPQTKPVPTTKRHWGAAVDDAGFSLLDQSVKLLQGMDPERLDLEHHIPEQSSAGLGMETITGESPTPVACGQNYSSAKGRRPGQEGRVKERVLCLVHTKEEEEERGWEEIPGWLPAKASWPVQSRTWY